MAHKPEQRGCNRPKPKKVLGAHDKNNENILRFEPNFVVVVFLPIKILILFLLLKNRKLHSKVNIASLQSVKLERFSW